MSGGNMALLVLGGMGIIALIAYFIAKAQDKKDAKNAKWKEMKDIWLDVNSGGIKFILDDDGNYKLKKV